MSVPQVVGAVNNNVLTLMGPFSVPVMMDIALQMMENSA